MIFFVSLDCNSREMLVSASRYKSPPVLFVYKSLISPIQTQCGLSISLAGPLTLLRLHCHF